MQGLYYSKYSRYNQASYGRIARQHMLERQRMRLLLCYCCMAMLLRSLPTGFASSISNHTQRMSGVAMKAAQTETVQVRGYCINCRTFSTQRVLHRAMITQQVSLNYTAACVAVKPPSQAPAACCNAPMPAP